MNFLAQKRKKVFLQEKGVAKPIFHESLYKQLAQLTASGSWTVNAQKKTSHIDDQARKILELPDDFRPSLKNALNFYDSDYHNLVTEKLYGCFQGKAFSLEVKMITYNKNRIWVKANGGPLYDENNHIIGAKGVFQDISEYKEREKEISQSLKIIQNQKDNLSQFANTVSRNLRSDINNLNLALELLEDAEEADKKELTRGLTQIAQQLNKTMDHLNEVIITQTRNLNAIEEIDLETLLQRVTSNLSEEISDTNTEIYSEFSEAPVIKYIPSFMESIFINLISNSIKYRDPERSPVIDIYSKKSDEGDICLVFTDNGIGIDLEKNGDKLFKMYQTFHNNQDAEGIGLYLVKNQVEALQGTIQVESELGKGATFRICI